MTDHSPNTEPASLFGRSRADVERALPEREEVVCPMCGTPPRPFAVDFQGLSLARCARCGLEFQSPRPTFTQLQRAVYGDAYHPPEQAAVDAARGSHYLRQLARLAQLTLPEGRDLLDVGCGAGAFLLCAGARGWRVEGTDVRVTEWAQRSACRLWEGQLPSIDFGSARYDVVRFNHVLEHTPQPLSQLRRAHELLRDDGILLVGVPNIAGLSIRAKSWQSRLGLKRKPWKHYGALHHLWFFTPATLMRLVEAAGFDVERWETPVNGKGGRPAWITGLVRWPLELTQRGGILDLYARKRQ